MENSTTADCPTMHLEIEGNCSFWGDLELYVDFYVPIYNTYAILCLLFSIFILFFMIKSCMCHRDKRKGRTGLNFVELVGVWCILGNLLTIWNYDRGGFIQKPFDQASFDIFALSVAFYIICFQTMLFILRSLDSDPIQGSSQLNFMTRKRKSHLRSVLPIICITLGSNIILVWIITMYYPKEYEYWANGLFIWAMIPCYSAYSGLSNGSKKVLREIEELKKNVKLIGKADDDDGLGASLTNLEKISKKMVVLKYLAAGISLFWFCLIPVAVALKLNDDPIFSFCVNVTIFITIIAVNITTLVITSKQSERGKKYRVASTNLFPNRISS